MAERKNILIAETETLNLDFFEVMLTKLGFAVLKAEDGQTALDKLHAGGVDVAIVNTILPEMSGWDVLKAVQSDDALAGVPVILLSDMANVKEQVESYERGAEDYITKPYNFSVVLARIRAALRKRELYQQLAIRDQHIALVAKIGTDVMKALSQFTQTVGSAQGGQFTDMRHTLDTLVTALDNAHATAAKLRKTDLGLPVLERPAKPKAS
jgi:DNA-binding response OmpR family regulator